MARMKLTRDEIVWTPILSVFFGAIVAALLCLALPGCNSDSSGGSSSVSGITSGSGGGGSQVSPAQQQFQSVVTQYNGIPNYTITQADIQTLGSQGLLQGNDQTTLNSLASNN